MLIKKSSDQCGFKYARGLGTNVGTCTDWYTYPKLMQIPCPGKDPTLGLVGNFRVIWGWSEASKFPVKGNIAYTPS